MWKSRIYLERGTVRGVDLKRKKEAKASFFLFKSGQLDNEIHRTRLHPNERFRLGLFFPATI